MRLYDIPMEYGTEKGTLNIGAQADLSVKNHDLWVQFNGLYKKIQNNDNVNEIELGRLMYVAYACAHISDDTMMTESDFLHNLSDDREALGSVFQQMFGVQEKKQVSQTPSKRKQRRKQAN